jgi:hypothetical protein
MLPAQALVLPPLLHVPVLALVLLLRVWAYAHV